VERDNIEADSKDEDGRTPLSRAPEEGHEAVVRLLVEQDDVEADSKDDVMPSLPRNPPIRTRWTRDVNFSLQRSVSVRSRAEVIIMHTPSTSDACETHA
jgi:ankyrin repeat protein